MKRANANSQSAVKGKESAATVFYRQENAPANKIFPVFYERIIFETDNALIVKYYSMMKF